MFELDEAQGAFEMVQAKILFPTPKPVIEVVGDNEFEIVPTPEIKVQTPVPATAVFPFIVVVGLEIQSV